VTEIHPASPAADAGRAGGEVVAASHLARWLSLAATPTFAVMAALTAVLGGGPADMLCSAGHGMSLGGMVPMYLLMSAFHAAAWLRLISGRRCASR
jgi:predicted phage tail protein